MGASSPSCRKRPEAKRTMGRDREIERKEREVKRRKRERWRQQGKVKKTCGMRDY